MQKPNILYILVDHRVLRGDLHHNPLVIHRSIYLGQSSHSLARVLFPQPLYATYESREILMISL